MTAAGLRSRWRSALRSAALGGALVALFASDVAAQGRRGCTLRLRADSSLSVLEGDARPESYVHYARDNVVTTCGDARITSDSAVFFERLGRVEMIGNVRYRDTTRVLDAQKLTFFEREDRVLTERSVVLTRVSSGAVLTGPRVEFFRTLRAGADRTLATRRPHLRLPTGPPGGGEEPFEIDADVIEFFGENRAYARGDVEIERTDLSARADSARFDTAIGEGWLFGTPVVESREVELSGDSVRAKMEAGELRVIEAIGDGRAIGDRFDLFSERIRVLVGSEDIDAMWAFGEGRSVAYSGFYAVAGDSLAFAFAGGQLDSLVAIGAARAVRTFGERAGMGAPGSDEPPLDTGDEGGWIVGDTVVARFLPATEGDGTSRSEKGLDALRAVGEARSYFSAVDSAGSGEASANYLIGRIIEVRFRDGEASEIEGKDAIGVYRGTGEEPGRSSRSRERPRTAPGPSDSVGSGPEAKLPGVDR